MNCSFQGCVYLAVRSLIFLLKSQELPLLIPTVMVHCHRRGTEALVGDLSHIFLYEQGENSK